MKKRGLAIENSFTLKFENTTNAVTEISLFEQGGSGSTQAKEVLSGNARSVPFGTLNLPNLIWNFSSSQPFLYNGGSNIPEQGYDTNNFGSTATGNLDIYANSGTFVSIPILAGDTINQVNEKIQAGIEANADLTNFLSPSGKFTQIRVGFDTNRFVSLFPLPIPCLTTFAQPRSCWFITCEYPTDSTIRWRDMIFPSAVNPCFIQIGLMSTIRTSAVNGVLIEETQGISYEEIMRSQTGSAYDVMSMGLDLGKSPTQDNKDAQMLTPFCFTKFDVNGNDLTYCKVPTKDPYQFQNSYGVIDMGVESDKYVLDGRTKFGYSIQPLTSVFLTYNYASINNLVFDTEFGLEKSRAEQKKLREYDRNKNVNRVLNLKITKEELATKPNKFSNFTNNAFKSKPKLKNALLGIGAIFLIYKLNQTK